MAKFEIDAAGIRIKGALRAPAANELRRLCEKLLEKSEGDLRLDLTGVNSIDSSCIAVLASLWVQTRGQKRRLTLAVSAAVRRILEYSGFDHVFALEDG